MCVGSATTVGKGATLAVAWQSASADAKLSIVRLDFSLSIFSYRYAATITGVRLDGMR